MTIRPRQTRLRVLRPARSAPAGRTARGPQSVLRRTAVLRAAAIAAGCYSPALRRWAASRRRPARARLGFTPTE